MGHGLVEVKEYLGKDRTETRKEKHIFERLQRHWSKSQVSGRSRKHFSDVKGAWSKKLEATAEDRPEPDLGLDGGSICSTKDSMVQRHHLPTKVTLFCEANAKNRVKKTGVSCQSYRRCDQATLGR